jgi:hypothetical protein
MRLRKENDASRLANTSITYFPIRHLHNNKSTNESEAKTYVAGCKC